MISIDTLSSLAALEALAPEWDALANGNPSPLARHAWFLAAARTYARGAELAIFTGRRGGRLRAIAPLVVDRSEMPPRLRLLGFESPEPQGLVFDDEEVLAAVCDAVLSGGRPLALPRLPADSPEWRLLCERAGGKGLAISRPRKESCYATVLQGDWPTFEASMTGKRRADLRRLDKLLAQRGTVTFAATSPHEDEVAAALDELVRVEAASWKGSSGTAIAVRPLLREFLSEYGRLAAREGRLRFAFLRVDDVAVAVQMDIEHAGRLWSLKIGVDGEWSKCAPAIVNMHRQLRWAAENGLAGFEHQGRAEDWQRRWPYEIRELSAFNFYPPRPGAMIALGRDVAGVVGRAAKQRLAGLASRTTAKE